MNGRKEAQKLELKIRQPERRHQLMKTPGTQKIGIEFVIIIGGAKTGKTLNKEALMRHYRCGECFDYVGGRAWALASFKNSLELTKAGRVMILSQTEEVRDPFSRRAQGKPRLMGHYVSIGEARVALGSEWVEPVSGYEPSTVKAAVKPVDGVGLIAAERQRQISDEGWTPEHDDHHSCGELLDAALSYGHAAINFDHPSTVKPPQMWPWEAGWWKPKDRIRNLVKMGALVAAEIDRLERLNSK